MNYTCEIIDNVLYLEENYKCTFLKAGINMKKRIFKNEKPYADIDLKLKMSIFKSYHKITFLDKKISSKVFYNGFIKASYTFKMEDDIYDVHPHRGSKTSIFKNNIQIAYYDRRLFNRFNKTVIDIIANRDTDIEIILLLISTIDFDFEDDSYTATIDLGNLLQSKKFDKEWTPS